MKIPFLLAFVLLSFLKDGAVSGSPPLKDDATCGDLAAGNASFSCNGKIVTTCGSPSDPENHLFCAVTIKLADMTRTVEMLAQGSAIQSRCAVSATSANDTMMRFDCKGKVDCDKDMKSADILHKCNAPLEVSKKDCNGTKFDPYNVTEYWTGQDIVGCRISLKKEAGGAWIPTAHEAAPLPFSPSMECTVDEATGQANLTCARSDYNVDPTEIETLCSPPPATTPSSPSSCASALSLMIPIMVFL